MSKLSSYNCLDFETANEQPCSVCSVGIAVPKQSGIFVVQMLYKMAAAFLSMANGDFVNV